MKTLSQHIEEKLLVNRDYAYYNSEHNLYLINNLRKMNWEYSDGHFHDCWKLTGDLKAYDTFIELINNNIDEKINSDGPTILKYAKNGEYVVGIGKKTIHIARADKNYYEGYHIYIEYGVDEHVRIMYKENDIPEHFALFNNKYGWWGIDKPKCYTINKEVFELIDKLYKELTNKK